MDLKELGLVNPQTHWYYQAKILPFKLAFKKYSKNSKIHFNIIGNEKCPKFDDIQNTTISFSKNSGFFMDDFNSLGQNSLIIGPPSTFSGMAAFIYNKPIWHFSAGDDIEIKKWLPTYY